MTPGAESYLFRWHSSSKLTATPLSVDQRYRLALDRDRACQKVAYNGLVEPHTLERHGGASDVGAHCALRSRPPWRRERVNEGGFVAVHAMTCHPKRYDFCPSVIPCLAQMGSDEEFLPPTAAGLPRESHQ